MRSMGFATTRLLGQVALAALWAAAGCRGDVAPESSGNVAAAITERDSAGIRVLEVGPIDRSRLPAWRLADTAGLRLGTIATLPGDEATFYAGSGLSSARQTLFGRFSVGTVSPTGSAARAILATTDDYGFTAYDGVAPSTIVRVEAERRAVPPGQFDAKVDSILEDSSNDRFRNFWRNLFTHMPRHDTYPAFLDLAADRAGRVWVEEVTDDTDVPREWTVFRDGRPVARVLTPRSLTILEIGSDEIIGRERDELETERVVVYPLIR
jgi:hypothetical protein